MGKCPKELCEHWSELECECILRKYKCDDYGRFLQGYGCALDDGLKNKCILKKKAKYKIGEYVFYFDSTNVDKYKTIEEAVLKVKIKTVGYWSPAHQPHYDIGVPSGVNGYTGRNEADLFKTKQECIKKFSSTFNDYRKNILSILQEKEREAKQKIEEYF